MCTITRMPLACAQRVISAATPASFTPEMPISPTRSTPEAAISRKSACVRPGSSSTAPACTFTPEGRRFANDAWAKIASAFTPAGSVGLPGVCGSPAEIIVVTPPWRYESMKSACRWRGV